MYVLTERDAQDVALGSMLHLHASAYGYGHALGGIIVGQAAHLTRYLLQLGVLLLQLGDAQVLVEDEAVPLSAHESPHLVKHLFLYPFLFEVLGDVFDVLFQDVAVAVLYLVNVALAQLLLLPVEGLAPVLNHILPGLLVGQLAFIAKLVAVVALVETKLLILVANLR